MNNSKNQNGAAVLAKAKLFVPSHYSTLADLISPNDTFSQIDENVFRESEYLGGMVAVLIELVLADQ